MKSTLKTDMRQMMLLSVVCLICLIPFIGKPLHIDDPLYVWTAKQIAVAPTDFYGYRINWDWGVELPASDIIKNPPGMSYLLALAGVAGNWSETWLHLLVVVISLFLILGTYCLARELEADPLVAALVTLCTPLFMMSATVVMGDILMATSWLWAVFFWIRGGRTSSHACLVVAALLVSVSFFTKYFGICLVPLLLCYQLIKRKNLALCLPYLLLPVLAVVVYQLWTAGLYGRGLLFDAARFSVASKGGKLSLFGQGFVCLVFTGGGMLSLVSLLPLVPGARKACSCLFVLFLVISSVLFLQGGYAGRPFAGPEGFQWLQLLHAALFGAVGTALIALLLWAVIVDRSAETLFLVLWIAGTLVFTAYLNWTISGRNLLPSLPAVGILAGRLLPVTVNSRSPVLRYGFFGPVLLLSLMVAWGDKSHAESARLAAVRAGSLKTSASQKLYFQGHWGFQYYLQLLGGVPADTRNMAGNRGDVLAIPANNSFTRMPDMNAVDLLETVTYRAGQLVSVMNPAAGAGYYASARGPLPYLFAKKHDETYYVFRYR
ncbi:ArnT family glycosyltransferase [Geoanaerobacter pelophilus]|nr:glycosyltransferase family 39 protein [Geoanaerobacter pelophilus]